MDNQYDVLIIGAGPAGLSAAIYDVRMGLKTLIVDKGEAGSSLYYAQTIENYPGVRGPLAGKKLLAIFKEQAQSFGAAFVKDQVAGVDFGSDTKKVFTGSGAYKAKAVIVATGSRGRKADIKGEDKLIGKGVSYCGVCDAPLYRGKDVALAGNWEEIREDLDKVARFTSKTYLVIPKKIQPNDTEKNKIPENAVIIDRSRVTEIAGKEKVESIAIKDNNDKIKVVPVAGIFIYLHGNKPSVDFLNEQIDLQENGCISVKAGDMSTSREGVFAAGDVTCKNIRQAVVVASEGCIAALAAERYLTKRDRPRSVWH